MRLLLSALILTLLYMSTVSAVEQTYTRDITIATGTLSQSKLQDKALQELKKRFTEEMGTLMSTSFEKETHIKDQQQRKEMKSIIKTYASAYIKTKVLREFIHGSQYSLFVEFKADPDDHETFFYNYLQKSSEEIPIWYEEPPKVFKKDSGRGKGESELLALSLALSDYIFRQQTYGEDSLKLKAKDSTKTVFNKSYGKVKLSGMYKRYISKNGEAKISLTLRVIFRPKHMISIFYENLLDDTAESDIFFSGRGASYETVLRNYKKQLKKMNFDIRTRLAVSDDFEEWYALVLGPQIDFSIINSVTLNPKKN